MFLIIFLPLYIAFTAVAFGFRSLRVYLLGALVSTAYFLGNLEMIIYIYTNKIPLNQVPALGFLVNVIVSNPYEGPYRPLVLSMKYYGIYFWVISVILLTGFFTLLFLKLANKPEESAE